MSFSNPSPSAKSSLYLFSKAAEIYLKKIKPMMTFLYSAAGICPQSTHAASHICFSKPISLLYYNNAKDYEKPKSKYLHPKIDEIIKEHGIHILEDFEQKFYKDFLKRIYENVCSFSHQDITELKISVLDSDSKINFFINSHKELLNDYLKTLLILVRIEFETFGYLNFADELFISKYKTLIIELDKFNQSIQE